MQAAERAKPRSGSDPLVGLSTLLQLEREARRAEDEIALTFLIANETWRLVPYDQAAVLSRHGRRAHLCAVGGTSTTDRNGGLSVWLRHITEVLAGSGARPGPVETASLPAKLAEDWERWAKPHAVWFPLAPPRGEVLGWLWLTRDEPFQAGETTLLERLAETYAHAWLLLRTRRSLAARLSEIALPRPIAWSAAIAALAALLALPVHQTALAPAEVVARHPIVVAAPLEGVVKEILARPNDPVREGQPLIRLDRARLEAEVEVAEKALAVAQANHLRASQKAFVDAESNAERAMLKARVEEVAAQLDYARQLLARTEIAAPRDGVVIFGGPEEWIGRPVRLGEGVVTVVDPTDVWLRVALPAADAIVLELGAPVKLFLDVDPTNPVPATLSETSYAPRRDDGGTLVYELKASFDGPAPRLGLTGTARLEGERVSLLAYLTRRPLIFLRRVLAL